MVSRMSCKNSIPVYITAARQEPVPSLAAKVLADAASAAAVYDRVPMPLLPPPEHRPTSKTSKNNEPGNASAPLHNANSLVHAPITALARTQPVGLHAKVYRNYSGYLAAYFMNTSGLTRIAAPVGHARTQAAPPGRSLHMSHLTAFLAIESS